MSTTCLTEKQIFALVDGGVPPNEAGPLQEHLAGCRACRDVHAEIGLLASDLAAPPDLDRDAHVAAVMSRLDEPRVVALPSVRRIPIAGVASALALAAALALLVGRPWQTTGGDTGFVARGGEHEATLDRDVGLFFFSGTSTLSPVNAGAQLAPNASISAAYTNIHPRPAYVLVFAVDARDTVHWLYPAFLDPKDDPPSLPLERADRPRHFATSVVLDGPARGAMRIVTVASETVLHVSEFERRAPADLALGALRRALSNASVTELVVEIK